MTLIGPLAGPGMASDALLSISRTKAVFDSTVELSGMADMMVRQQGRWLDEVRDHVDKVVNYNNHVIFQLYYYNLNPYDEGGRGRNTTATNFKQSRHTSLGMRMT